MYRGYYRRVKGWDGKRYQVSVPEEELRGLITTIVISAAAISLVLAFAAFMAGMSVR